MNRLLVAIIAALCPHGVSSCGDDLDTCVEFCERCPDGQIITPSTDCDNFCNAWRELVARAGCEEKWKAGWDCFAKLDGCPSDDPQQRCAGDQYDWEDCAEDWCQNHEAECDEIGRKYGMK